MLNGLSCAEAILFALISGDIGFEVTRGVMRHDGHEYYEVFIDEPCPFSYDDGVTFYFLPDGSWDEDSHHYIY